MAENMTPAPSNDGPKPAFYTAFGRNGAALPQYAAYSEHAVIAEVLAVARNQGFKGTGEERMRDLGWMVKPVFNHEAIETLERELHSWQITAENKDKEIAQLKGELEAVGAGGVQALRAAVPPFNHVSQYKLDQLLEQGHVITGYAIEKPSAGAQPSRGFINSGGFVGWWSDNMHATPAAPAAVGVTVVTRKYADGVTVTGAAPLPDMSPRQQVLMTHMDAIEAMLGGANGPTIQIRAALATTQMPVCDSVQTEVSGKPASTAGEIATAVCRRVAELDDRSSPEGQPDMMLVTRDELHGFICEALATTPEVGPTESVLINDEPYTIPEAVAHEILRLHLELAQQAEVVSWDGKLSDQLQRAINDLHIECKPAVVRHLEHEVRSEMQALSTSYETVKRMYAAARDRLEEIDAAQPDPFATPAKAEVQAEPAWCEYVAGIVATYVGFKTGEEATDERIKAIAGIIQRRMMFLASPQATQQDAIDAGLLEALQELVEDVSDRFDMSDQCTSPGLKSAIARGRSAIDAAIQAAQQGV